MIGKKMQDAMNGQLQAEMYSAYLYLSMSAYCESINMRGFAHWLLVQSREEQEHAMKFFNHLIDRSGKVSLGAIEQPPLEFQSPRALFEHVLDHEKKITERIHKLYEMAMSEKDYASQTFLQWFISEQVEEEARATEYVEKLKMIGESSNAIFMLDKELGKRASES
jgi:ferritin